MFRRTLALLLLICALLTVGIGSAAAARQDPVIEPDWWGSLRAFQVSFTHYDPWYEPHYGAWFSNSGSMCGGQHYLAESGDATTSPFDGGIANWNWWGTPPNVILTPKTFLGWPNMSGPRWDGNNYEATCWFN